MPSKRLKTGTPLMCEYLPVRMQARLGVQIELTQKHWLKRMPSAARRSMLRRLVHPAAVGADGVGRMVVGHDVQDVRPRRDIGGTWPASGASSSAAKATRRRVIVMISSGRRQGKRGRVHFLAERPAGCFAELDLFLYPQQVHLATSPLRLPSPFRLHQLRPL